MDALRKIEVGDRTGRAETLARLAATLGITLADLYVEGPPVAPHAGEYVPLGDARPVPVIGWVEAGQFTPASDGDFLPGDADDYVYTTTPGRYLFALTISGDSMEPEFAAGDVILVAPDREPAPGDFVVAKLDDEGEATVKQYWPQGTGSDARIILRPLNPRHNDIVVGPDSGCRIIGKVVESKTLFPSGAPPPSTPCATPPYMVAEHAQSRSPGRALGRIVARVQEFAGEPAPSVAPAPTGPTSTSDVSHDDAPSPYAELSDWELMERIHERLAELDRAGLERLLAAVGDAHT